MAQVSLSIIFLLLTIFCATSTADRTVQRHSRARAFVQAQCRSTQFPKLCFESLFGHVNVTMQSQRQLAQIALTVSLAKARYTSAYVTGVAEHFSQTRGSDYQAVKDCLRQINDGVGQIALSIKELGQMDRDGEGAFFWHESNVKSWISAAQTDASTCIDGFSGHAVGGKIKATIKAKVLNVAQVTSNALALFNRFAARHRAERANKKP